MIGYYVHHVGRGHLHRAQVLAAELELRGEIVTGLSSLARPPGWHGDWVRLANDADGVPVEESAHGRLHWVPLRDRGLRSRMAAVSAWIEAARPQLVVVDVSVEIVLLARLHGVPTMSVVLPGRRDDPAHDLGHDVADALVSFWPGDVVGMVHGLSQGARSRLVPLGALSRHPVATTGSETPRGRNVVLMLGAGGHDITQRDIDAAVASSPRWNWVVLDGRAGTWVEDPAPLLRNADVVVTHAGQNAIAETAAARTPAVVIPQDRPHHEQRITASVLASDWPATVCTSWAGVAWASVLDRTAALDGGGWSRWCDGLAAGRFAEVTQQVIARAPVGAAT